MNENDPKQTQMINETNQQDLQPEGKKERSIFKIVSVVLIVLFAVAIVVQIGILIWLQSETNNLKNKNDKIPSTEGSYSISINCFNNFDNDILIDKI